MINRELIAPESIVIIGGSNNTQKPGGKIIRNLLEGKFPGKLYAVNPKETEVQGIPCFPDITSLPNTELAILAVPAAACPSIVEELASTRNTKAFIIISAGFGEETHEGFLLEQEILKTANKYEASLIGPNCIGLMNRHHRSVFTPADSRTRFPRCRSDIEFWSYCRIYHGVRYRQRTAVQFCMVGRKCTADRSRRCLGIS